MSSPVYLISATPLEPSMLKNFFDSTRGSLMDALSNPPGFRYAGWDLQTLDRARIVDGEYLEVSNGDRKRIQLYEDGTLLAKASAGPDFLAWGRDSPDFANRPRLNPVALIEFTTSFVHFYKSLVPHFDRTPEKIRLTVAFRDAVVGTNRLYLTEHGVNSMAWMLDDQQHKIAKPDIEKNIEMSLSEISKNPDSVAYQLIKRVYLFFGIPTDKIPYVINEQPRRVDVSSFSKS